MAHMELVPPLVVAAKYDFSNFRGGLESGLGTAEGTQL